MIHGVSPRTVQVRGRQVPRNCELVRTLAGLSTLASYMNARVCGCALLPMKARTAEGEREYATRHARWWTEKSGCEGVKRSGRGAKSLGRPVTFVEPRSAGPSTAMG
jgi:hypothetical protein